MATIFLRFRSLLTALALIASMAGVFLFLAPRPSIIHASPEPVTITVRIDQPGARISPQLYGVFFEEINHAGDGGLYAELLRNRGIEEPVGPGGQLPGWILRADSAARAVMIVDTAQQLSESNPHSLRLDIHGSGKAAIINSGY